MGRMIRLVCHQCKIERTENIGMGMMGHGSELCGCTHCHRYVMKETSWDDRSESADLTCPDCDRSVKPIENGDACPVCGSPIRIDLIGMWD